MRARAETGQVLGNRSSTCRSGSAVILTAPVGLPNGGGQDDRAPTHGWLSIYPDTVVWLFTWRWK